jgi:hypothetical protein
MKKMKILLVMMAAMAMLWSTLPASGQGMTAAPSTIILNANGNTLDFKAIWSGYLASGSIFVSHDIQLYVNGVWISDAYHLTYCWIDARFTATFDRYTLLNDPYVQSLANSGPVTAMISGTYTVSNAGTITQFTIAPHSAPIEIVQPTGKKGK